MTTAIIVQARTGSTRLPAKILKKIEGVTLLEILINRLKKVRLADKIIVATTTSKSDGQIIDLAKKSKVEYFAGSEQDVLDRYYNAAKKVGAKTIVRITSDCPLVDPKIIDEVIELFFEKKVDYASNVAPPTYPDGFDTEVFSFNALENAWKNAKTPAEREHVTPFLRESGKFKTANLENKTNLSKVRLTVDNIEDYTAIKEIFEKLEDKTDFGLSDVMKVIKENPHILEYNKMYERNKK